tara:strand:- start:1833 stop:1973 length:141 start_codon:yes stop_codon:yes gene_type:complete
MVKVLKKYTWQKEQFTKPDLAAKIQPRKNHVISSDRELNAPFQYKN